jgi:hypothetical protein
MENGGSLIQFPELHATANGSGAKPEPTRGAIPPEIEQLRNRLMSREFCDPVEVQIKIVGELFYQGYKDLITRKRYL